MTTAPAEVKCTLLLSSPQRGERVLVRSDVPLEAEYGMFEIGEIELRTSEPGRIREHGYQTTVQKARARLANVGMSAAVAREVAQAMAPVLPDAYARGEAARRVARYLSPAELFRADGYDGATHLYRGVFLDVAALAKDLEIDNAAATFQALYLASVLENEDDETEVIINTDACTKGGKPGTRTYKRPSFTELQRLLNAIGGLSHKNPQAMPGESLPRATVIEFLRGRQETAPDDDSRALYKSLELAVSAREMPERGPLSIPELWQIEQRVESNQFEGTLDAVDDVERRHGRTPGTTYLRARIALELRLEPPKLIAERVSALALSMTSFQELALLAAEAWLEAGDPRRAMPYARDLVNAPNIDEGLLLRAQSLLERAESNKPRRRMSPTLVEAQRPAPLASRPSQTVREEVPPVPETPEQQAPTAPPPPLTNTAPPPADAEPFTHGVGIEDLVLEEDPPKPQRSIPPPVPTTSRSMRAAPPVAMPSSRRMPAAQPSTPSLGSAPPAPPSAPRTSPSLGSLPAASVGPKPARSSAPAPSPAPEPYEPSDLRSGLKPGSSAHAVPSGLKPAPSPHPSVPSDRSGLKPAPSPHPSVPSDRSGLKPAPSPHPSVPSDRSGLKPAPSLGSVPPAAPSSAPRTAPSAPPVRSSRPSGSAPTLDEIAIPDIPHTEPEIPPDRPSSFPSLRAQRPVAAEPLPMSIPPPLDLDLTPGDPAASFTLDLPGPDAVPEPVPMSQPVPSRRPRLGMVTETRPPASFDPRAEPDAPLIPIPRAPSVAEMRAVSIPTPRMRSQPAPARRSLSPAEPSPFENVPPAEDPFSGASFGASEPADLDEPTPPRMEAPPPLPPLPLVHGPSVEETAPSLPPPADFLEAREPSEMDVPGPVTPSALPPPADLPLIDASMSPRREPDPFEEEEPPPPAQSFMRGASMFPYRVENPPPLLPKAPLLPKSSGDELAEHLSLPNGFGGEARSLDALPGSVLEARIQFTLLSRELGLDYRLKRGIALHANVNGIEHMQAVLADMFPDRVIHTKEDLYEVRRHGAFLSEILARRLDAEWVDISSEELGHWVMIVPPDTRVWPFGRVVRHIAMGQKERDLVAYFLELTARCRPR